MLHDKGSNQTPTDEFDGYLSTEIISKFQKSQKFLISSNSNIKIKIVPMVDDVKPPLLTMIGFFFTIGAFPAIYRTYGSVSFELYDQEKHKTIRTYKYSVNHRIIFGLAPILLGPILSTFTDRFDHSTSDKTYSIMRVVFAQFEYDLFKDIRESKELASRFFSTNEYNHALIVTSKSVKDEPIISSIYSELNKNFIKYGISILERRRLDQVINEIQLSLTGITQGRDYSKLGKLLQADRLILVEDLNITSATTDVSGRINFSIRCVDSDTGKVIWSEKIAESILLSDTVDTVVSYVARKLVQKLKQSGEI
ncbi:hypothetical protein EHQ81_04510 [Leptospira selangorensis]|nr:hypothetical protein [Leptospira selangorensis]TGM15661.1 hypothetical protein EHQ81_04510 [Leptospira selangorensis]